MTPAINQENFIRLDYDAEINVLMVKWVNEFTVPWHEILNSYKQLVNCINQHQVPNLLIDSMNDTCSEHGKDLNPLIIQFSLDLASTNLKKVARVIPEQQQIDSFIFDDELEYPVEPPFFFESRNFNDKANALEWLNSHDG